MLIAGTYGHRTIQRHGLGRSAAVRAVAELSVTVLTPLALDRSGDHCAREVPARDNARHALQTGDGQRRFLDLAVLAVAELGIAVVPPHIDAAVRRRIVQVNGPPTAMAETPLKPATATGVGELVVVPLPSSPDSLLPQHATVPPDSNAHAYGIHSGRDRNCDRARSPPWAKPPVPVAVAPPAAGEPPVL